MVFQTAEAFLCSWWLSGSLRHRGPRLRPHLHGEALFTRCLWEVGSCSPRLPWSTASFSTGLLRPLSASPVSATPGPQPELGEQATHMPLRPCSLEPRAAASFPPRFLLQGIPPGLSSTSVALCVGCTSGPHAWLHLPSQVRSREQGSRGHPLQRGRRWGPQVGPAATCVSTPAPQGGFEKANRPLSN